jgi:hypothetical protein
VSPPQELCYIIPRILELYPQLSTHRCGSHVLEAAIWTAPRLFGVSPPEGEEEEKGEEENEKQDQQPPPATEDAFLGFVEALCEDSHLRSDVYGTHIVRATVGVLAGIPPAKQQRSKSSKAYRSGSGITSAPLAAATKGGSLPESFPAALSRLTDSILQVERICSNPCLHWHGPKHGLQPTSLYLFCGRAISRIWQRTACKAPSFSSSLWPCRRYAVRKTGRGGVLTLVLI